VIVILYLSASTGKNLELANTLAEVGGTFGGEHEVINLVAENLPLYCVEAEKDGIPEQAKILTQKLSDANAFVFIAPEYNGGVPPVLSNAIAWISRSGGDDWRAAFSEKMAAVATHSGGGGAKVLSVMRSQLEHLGTNVIARQLLTHYQKALNPDSAKAVIDQLLKLSKK
jgi:chromate reductase, NAD(P)H dehydrogenase (quinone)